MLEFKCLLDELVLDGGFRLVGLAFGSCRFCSNFHYLFGRETFSATLLISNYSKAICKSALPAVEPSRESPFCSLCCAQMNLIPQAGDRLEPKFALALLVLLMTDEVILGLKSLLNLLYLGRFLSPGSS